MGRTAVVTGGAQGIGAAVAAELHARGHSVALLDIDGEKAAGTAEQIGPRAAAFTADVRDPAAVRDALDGVRPITRSRRTAAGPPAPAR